MELYFLLPPLLLLWSVLLLQQSSMALHLHPNMGLQLRDEGEDQLFRRPYNLIVHPPTGFCVLRKTLSDPLKLGPCANSDAWTHTPQNFLVIKGTYFCLQAVGAGKPARLSINCTPSNSQWNSVSDSEKTHLTTKLANGETLCLEVGSDNTLISSPCKSERDVTTCDSDSQWFTIITTRGGASLKLEDPLDQKLS